MNSFRESFKSNRTKRIEVNLSDLNEFEAKKVEAVLRRAEKIRGNGVLFQVDDNDWLFLPLGSKKAGRWLSESLVRHHTTPFLFF